MAETIAQIQAAIDRLNGGDPKALDDLFSRAVERLRRRAHQMLAHDRVHGREQTDDLVQEACLRLWRSLASSGVKTPAEFFRLARKVMANTLIDLARHHYGPEGSAANQANVPLGGNSSAPGFTPSDSANAPARVAKSRDLHEAIDALPDKLREVCDLVYMGYTHEEISQALGVSVPTVKRRWSDAKVELMDNLSDDILDEL